MGYEDEKLVLLKKQARNLRNTNIKESGVYIQDQYVQFEQFVIFDKIHLYLPADFIDLPESIKIMKYPSVNRPDVIKSNLNTSVNFAFNLLNSTDTDQTDELKEQMKNAINKTNPSFIFYEDREAQTLQDYPISMFDYKSYGIDEQLYNMICIVPLKCGTLQGIFNCLDRECEDWKEIAWQVFQSLEEQE